MITRHDAQTFIAQAMQPNRDYHRSELHEAIAAHFGVTPEEREARYDTPNYNGRYTRNRVFNNTVDRAIQVLKDHEVIRAVRRGVYRTITA